MRRMWWQWRVLARRWKNRLLIAFGGHETKLRLLRKTGMRIGRNCRVYTENFGGEPYLIRIGDHCTVTSGVRFVTHDGACWVCRDELPNLQDFGPIRLHDNCFIGVNAVILPHVRIGPNSIVAAGAVVAKDVPPNTVVGGIPARPIMTLENYRTRKAAQPDAQQVPLPGPDQRSYLEKKYGEFLDGES